VLAGGIKTTKNEKFAHARTKQTQIKNPEKSITEPSLPVENTFLTTTHKRTAKTKKPEPPRDPGVECREKKTWLRKVT